MRNYYYITTQHLLSSRENNNAKFQIILYDTFWHVAVIWLVRPKCIARWCIEVHLVAPGGRLSMEAKSTGTTNNAACSRNLIGIAIPFVIVQTCWWLYMMINFELFNTVFIESVGNYSLPRYTMTIVMVFGSMVAGATSEGGASIAFPVMTLALNINPVIARDFSFMIQSIGMTAAAFTIIFMKLRLEWKSILWSSVGGTFGLVFSLECIAPFLPPPYSKMYFVTIWAAFALSLYLLNKNRDRHVFERIPEWNVSMLHFRCGIVNTKIIILLATGFVGGILSAISGSGIDICTFAVLTLLFRVSEKVATPTSVVIMAINTCVGFFWRGLIQNQIEIESWRYFAVCIPVVVIN